ncbi:hypothetical protein BHE74_00011464 [Ensete ventricosum]|nr:hypothetical protein BHE74_00011464 [Ensete ventricosum]RZR91953.1 hypothetical protein BHM03_00020144 [Ensete ventricosum]
MDVKDRLGRSGRQRVGDDRSENVAGSSELHSFARVRRLVFGVGSLGKKSRPFLPCDISPSRLVRLGSRPSQASSIRFNGRSSYGPWVHEFNNTPLIGHRFAAIARMVRASSLQLQQWPTPCPPSRRYRFSGEALIEPLLVHEDNNGSQSTK